MGANYVELLAGSEALTTTLGLFVSSGDVIPALTPLMLSAQSNALVAWDGEASGQAIYVSAFQVDTASQTSAQVYKTGTLNVDALNWPENVTTLAAKMAAFAGSGVSVQPLQGAYIEQAGS